MAVATVKVRDNNLDALKGGLIICVVLGHLSGFFQVVYWFHIPLFLAVATILTRKFSWEYLKKRAWLILCPFVFWSLFALLESYGYGNSSLTEFFNNLKYFWLGSYKYLNNIFWFLPAVFSCSIIYSLYKKYENYKIFLLMLVIWLTMFFEVNLLAKWHVAGYLPFGLNIALYFFPYFWLINYLYINKEQYNKLNNVYLLLIIFVSGSAFYFFEPIKTHTLFLKRIDLAQFSVPVTAIGYLAFSALSGAIFIFFMKLKNLYQLNILGNYSLPIYLMHIELMARFISLFKRLPQGLSLNIYFIFFFSCLTFFSCLLLPIFISKIFIKISPKFKYLGMN